MALNHFKAKLFSGLRHFYAIHFGGIKVEIVPSEPPKSTGGGISYQEYTYDIIITIRWNGKVYQKRYYHLPIEWVVTFLVKIRSISIIAAFKSISEKVYNLSSSINSTKPIEPTIKAESKDIEITVKRKK